MRSQSMNIIRNLSQIEPGQLAVVKHLNTTRSMRKRLLDLGLTEQTEVRCLGRSPLGDPSAYLIRGAVIAIRSRDSRNIIVEMKQESQSYEI